jgi:hypothetical protein
MRRPDLVPDCGSCAALCCVAISFEASEHFAFDKPAGVACRNLARDHRCTIHALLVERGMSGCAAYDCYGAGQRATAAFAGAPASSRKVRNEFFLNLRVLHELVWLGSESLALCPVSGADLRQQLARALAELEALAARPPEELLGLDLSARDRELRALVRRVGDALGGRAAAQRA